MYSRLGGACRRILTDQMQRRFLFLLIVVHTEIGPSPGRGSEVNGKKIISLVNTT